MHIVGKSQHKVMWKLFYIQNHKESKKFVRLKTYETGGMLMLNPPPTHFGLFGGVTDAMIAIS